MKADTYLVCPYNDDEIEAARVRAYKLREEHSPQKNHKSTFFEDATPQEIEDFERLKALLDDRDPLLSTQCVRKYYYRQLNREQMQGIVAWYYVWEEWSEDPWGSLPEFLRWQNSARDNEMAVWAVNETLMGRKYLAASALYRLNQIDFSRVTGKGLLDYIGIGAASFLLVKRHTGWELENFADHYPGESLPAGLVNARVSKVYPFDFKLPFEGVTFPLSKKPDGTLDVPGRVVREPFDETEDLVYLVSENQALAARYRLLISSIYAWYLAMAEAVERAKGNPELEFILSYHAATHAPLGDLCQKLAPNGYHLLDKEESFESLVEAKFKMLDGIRRSKRRYTEDEAYGEGLLGLFKGVGYWDGKLDVPETLIALLSGEKEKWIDRSIQKIIRCRFYDKVKEENPQFVKRWERALRTEKPKGQADRYDLAKKLAEEYKKKVPEWEKPPLSLDQRMASDRRYDTKREARSEDDNPRLLDLVNTELAPIELAEMKARDEREMVLAARREVGALIAKTGLTKRRQLVIDLTLKGKSDRAIELALVKTFRKKSSPGNVRALRHAALQKLRERAKQLGLDLNLEEEDIFRYRDATLKSQPTVRIPDKTPFKAITGEEP